MAKLQQFQAKVCLTAAGILLHQGKVLLVKHKKLGIWLNPGGHIEPNELPHQAAEREFWEETGVRVEAYTPGLEQAKDESEYLPNPLFTNLHWISKENYQARTSNQESKDKVWGKGCEQHLGFLYLVRPINGQVAFKENREETDGIAWFSEDEIDDLETSENIRFEVKYAFQLQR
ncbi:MAG TPA: NUDIX domain-containing protein [Patescibacteria group bacterium]